MPKPHLHVSSNLEALDRAPFLRGFAGFLTGAVSDGSFVIAVKEERAAPPAGAGLLTERPGTATLPMKHQTPKGAYEWTTSPPLRPGEFPGPETAEPG
jgi:hypothetical protein